MGEYCKYVHDLLGEGIQLRKYIPRVNECSVWEIVCVHLNMLTHVLSIPSAVLIEWILYECSWFLVLQLDSNADKINWWTKKREKKV